MLRYLLFAFTLLLPAVSAQDAAMNKFLTDFGKALQFNDEKGMDKAVKAAPQQAMRHFQNLRIELWGGKQDVKPQVDAIAAAWKRALDGSTALERIDRWVDSQDQKSYQAYVKARNALDKCYSILSVATESKQRKDFEVARDSTISVAKAMEETSHKVDAAEAWVLVSIIYTQMPEKTLEERRDSVFALEQFVAARDAWGWTQDEHYPRNKAIIKAEKERIAADEAAGEKRKNEGYGDNTKGIDALVMPGAKEEVHDLAFAALQNVEELDYCIKGGALPQFWWEAQVTTADTQPLLAWFRSKPLHVVQVSGSKFAVTPEVADKALQYEIDAGNKPKVTSFFVDKAKKSPYAMWFWTGSDKERVGEMDVNLMPTPEFTPIFYRSAASWSVTHGTEQVTYYDDNCNGTPMDGDPFAGDFKSHAAGNPDGIAVPLMDSMRVGKGARMPYSEFVKLGDAWWHQKASGEGKSSFRPLNPEYFKTGKVKLNWAGPKPTAPVQLVIQGRGDFRTAFFDVAGGKEVDVPAGEYVVCVGRILQGKGAKAQSANIFQGAMEAFTVEAGKTFELKMGAPFALVFTKGGTDSEVAIDATRIHVKDRAGASIVEFHGMTLIPEVLAAKAADGKGAKVIGKFVRMEDPEFLGAAAREVPKIGRFVALFPMPEGAKGGSLTLKVKPPFPDAKIGLSIKKHALFGKLDSSFQ